MLAIVDRQVSCCYFDLHYKLNPKWQKTGIIFFRESNSIFGGWRCLFNIIINGLPTFVLNVATRGACWQHVNYSTPY